MRFLPLIALTLLFAIGSLSAAADATSTCINATCPISGKAVDPSIRKVPFPGKTAPAGSMVGFCCPKCEATYDKDPAKCEEDLTKQMNDKAKK